MKTLEDLQSAVDFSVGLIDRARFITEGAPFFMIAEEEFAKIVIDGEMATLFWPEINGGYYAGDGCMERQNCSFPASLLLLSLSELKAWKLSEQARHDAKERENSERAKRERAVVDRQLELSMLAALKAKYGG